MRLRWLDRAIRVKNAFENIEKQRDGMRVKNRIISRGDADQYGEKRPPMPSLAICTAFEPAAEMKILQKNHSQSRKLIFEGHGSSVASTDRFYPFSCHCGRISVIVGFTCSDKVTLLSCARIHK